jgi:3-oxoacyl-[acyl-carrier-protein] synthase III
MRVDDMYFAGIGTADHELVDTADAVRRGWYDAEERERGGMLSVSVAGDTPAPDLAVSAARRALAGAGHAPSEICAVFHTNVHPQGPDGWSAQHYINRNTINRPVTSVEIHNGCVGFFSSIDLASCYLAAAPDRQAALVTSADNFGTPLVDRWRTSRLFVLADGGGAVVLSKRGGFARLLALGTASNPELEERHRAGMSLFPPSLTTGGVLNFEERMAYRRRKEADGTLRPLPDFGTVLADTVERTMKEAGIAMADIVKVVHDGYTRAALDVLYLEPLGFSDEHGIWEFTRRVGHAGPTDQIRGLEHVWRAGEVTPGDKVLLVSDAPGMETACAVLEITARPQFLARPWPARE